MQVVNLKEDGQLKAQDVRYLGGRFSWLDVIKLRGIGSTKFIYVSGIEGFDPIKELSTALDYVSLELFKEGLVIRFNKRNNYKACTIRYAEIKEVSVTSQRIRN